jgi:hypothetical protein
MSLQRESFRDKYVRLMDSQRYRGYMRSPGWRAVERRARIECREQNGYDVICSMCLHADHELGERVDAYHSDFRYVYRELDHWDEARHTVILLCPYCARKRDRELRSPSDV